MLLEIKLYMPNLILKGREELPSFYSEEKCESEKNKFGFDLD